MATAYETLEFNKARIYGLAGINVLSSTPVAATPTTILASNYLVEVDTSALAITVNLPATPYIGEEHQIVDNTGNSNANNITVSGNGRNINGAASMIINTSYGSRSLRWNGTQWIMIARV